MRHCWQIDDKMLEFNGKNTIKKFEPKYASRGGSPKMKPYICEVSKEVVQVGARSKVRCTDN